MNVNGRTLLEKVLTSAVEDTKSIFKTYYSAQSTSAFEMFNKKIFANLADDWIVEIGGIENPVWNYDSFARYQYLDHNMLSVSRYEELYYCTFSTDNDKSGYVVMSYDGSSLQKISFVETSYLFDLQVNIDEIINGIKETDIDLSSTTASRVKWVDTDKNRSDEALPVCVTYRKGLAARHFIYVWMSKVVKVDKAYTSVNDCLFHRF